MVAFWFYTEAKSFLKFSAAGHNSSSNMFAHLCWRDYFPGQRTLFCKMIMQNNPSSWNLESTGAILGLLRSLADMTCTISVLFLVCVQEQNLFGEFIFHFPGVFGIRKAKRPRCFNSTFDGWFWHLYQQKEAMCYQLNKSHLKP